MKSKKININKYSYQNSVYIIQYFLVGKPIWRPLNKKIYEQKVALINDAMELYYDGGVAPSGNYNHPVVVKIKDGYMYEISAHQSVAPIWDNIIYTTSWAPIRNYKSVITNYEK